MLDGIWRVYDCEGNLLTWAQTRIGNGVLILNSEDVQKVSVGQTLHIDETHTNKAWTVRVDGPYLHRENELSIKFLGDRGSQYPYIPEVKGRTGMFNFFRRLLQK